jgi:hypothetical protein
MNIKKEARIIKLTRSFSFKSLCKRNSTILLKKDLFSTNKTKILTKSEIRFSLVFLFVLIYLFRINLYEKKNLQLEMIIILYNLLTTDINSNILLIH